MFMLLFCHDSCSLSTVMLWLTAFSSRIFMILCLLLCMLYCETFSFIIIWIFEWERSLWWFDFSQLSETCLQASRGQLMSVWELMSLEWSCLLQLECICPAWSLPESWQCSLEFCFLMLLCCSLCVTWSQFVRVLMRLWFLHFVNYFVSLERSVRM